MNQIFIEVCEGDTFYNVNIEEATQAERHDYYNKISKGKVIKMLEQLLYSNKKLAKK